MGAHWLVLGSSNSNREYVADVLEAMAVPVGFVMYFRYQKRWVEPSLWQQLPIKNSGAANALIGQKTLVVLPYGERPDPSKPVEFKQVYPVRVARIKEAHKTGTEDSDIAHFHFELSSYACRRPNTNLVQYLPEFNQGQFAYFREDITDIQQLDSQERDFLQVVNSLDPQHFKYFDATPFYPVFCCVRGLSGAKSSYNPEFRQLEYTLQEGHSQRVDVTLQLHQPPKSDSKLLWAFNEKQFAIVPRNEVEIASRYNELRWVLSPLTTANDEHAAVAFKTQINSMAPLGAVAEEGKEPKGPEVINVNLSLPIKITYNRTIRLWTSFIEVLPGFAGAAIGWVGILNGLKDNNQLRNFLLVLIGIYVIINLGVVVWRTLFRSK